MVIWISLEMSDFSVFGFKALARCRLSNDNENLSQKILKIVQNPWCKSSSLHTDDTRKEAKDAIHNLKDMLEGLTFAEELILSKAAMLRFVAGYWRVQTPQAYCLQLASSQLSRCPPQL